MIFELGDAAFVCHELEDLIAGICHHLIGFFFAAPVVVLFQGQGELAGADGAAAVHETAEGFGLDDELVEAVEDGFHVHYSEISLETHEFSFFGSFLAASFLNYFS